MLGKVESPFGHESTLAGRVLVNLLAVNFQGMSLLKCQWAVPATN